MTGLQFNICCVIKTRVGFNIAEMTRFSNYVGSYSFALENSIKSTLTILKINLKVSENSQEYVFILKLFSYKAFKYKVIIHVKFFSRDFV